MGATLHLIHPLGFSLEQKHLRRAGLDYHEWTTVHEYPSLESFVAQTRPLRTFGFTTRGTRGYAGVKFEKGDSFLFGPETRGLPTEVLQTISEERRLRIPMVPGGRSLNLSNAVAVVCYEAWRQQNFVNCVENKNVRECA